MNEMTMDDLVAWASRNGHRLIPVDEFEQLCARVASAAAAQVDFDRQFDQFFGQPE